MDLLALLTEITQILEQPAVVARPMIKVGATKKAPVPIVPTRSLPIGTPVRKSAPTIARMLSNLPKSASTPVAAKSGAQPEPNSAKGKAISVSATTTKKPGILQRVGGAVKRILGKAETPVTKTPGKSAQSQVKAATPEIGKSAQGKSSPIQPTLIRSAVPTNQSQPQKFKGAAEPALVAKPHKFTGAPPPALVSPAKAEPETAAKGEQDKPVKAATKYNPANIADARAKFLTQSARAHKASSNVPSDPSHKYFQPSHEVAHTTHVALAKKAAHLGLSKEAEKHMKQANQHRTAIGKPELSYSVVSKRGGPSQIAMDEPKPTKGSKEQYSLANA